MITWANEKISSSSLLHDTWFWATSTKEWHKQKICFVQGKVQKILETDYRAYFERVYYQILLFYRKKLHRLGDIE